MEEKEVSNPGSKSEATRQKSLTERGLQYEVDTAFKLFRAEARKFTKLAMLIDILLGEDNVDEKRLRSSRDELNIVFDEVSKYYDRLNKIDNYEPEPTVHSKYDTVETETFRLSKSLSEQIAQLVLERKSQNGDQSSTSEPSVRPPEPVQAKLLEALCEQTSISRLPLPEPNIFDGDPLNFPGWKQAFSVLIERRGILASDKIHYLKRYLSGSALECVEGYFLIPTGDSYHEAMCLLEKRFGNPFSIGTAFKEKLESWPKIANNDALALRKFADFLRQCLAAKRLASNLSCLDDEMLSQRLLAKLPKWLVARWARVAADHRKHEYRYPAFSRFVEFVTDEADIACDPITSMQNLNVKAKEPQTKTKTAKSFQTKTKGKPKDSEKSKTIAKCICCDQVHHVLKCPTFECKTFADKQSFIQGKGLCYGCLEKGHMKRDCKAKVACDVCQKRHPTVLHKDGKPESATGVNVDATPFVPIASTMATASQSLSSKVQSQCSNKSSMIVPVWMSHKAKPGQETLVYALLDTQSDTTFLLERTARDLRFPQTEVNLILSTMTSENQTIKSSKITGLKVRNFSSQCSVDLPAVYTRDIMPANRSHIPTAEIAQQWLHLKSLRDKIPPLQTCDVALLIGYDCAKALAPLEVIPPVNEGPYGQRTVLGWGIIGIVNSITDEDSIGYSHRVLTQVVPQRLMLNNVRNEVYFSAKTSVSEVITPSAVAKMMELDFNDHFDSKQVKQSREDKLFLSIMEKGIHRSGDNFEMPLPFKMIAPRLPNNKPLALKRLFGLRKRLLKDDKFKGDYNDFMNDLIQKGFAEEVPVAELDYAVANYIPHHGVYNPNKPKIRVVFDCSAKTDGVCINDVLLQGPNLTNSLIGVLSRFRLEPICLMCDVEKMFYMFKVNKEHRDYLRFLWFRNGDVTADIVEYRMTVHLFGAVSSPSCSNYGLKQIASEFSDKYGEQTSRFIKEDFYVDDGLKSVSDEDTAIQLIHDSINLCKEGGLKLHKFVSNSAEVMNKIPLEYRAKGVEKIDLLQSDLPVERALGVRWCLNTDTFQFQVNLKDKPLTRRGILSTVSSIYDPLGFVAPFTLLGKQLLQELCKEQRDWDEKISPEFAKRWLKWKSEAKKLEQIRIPRCVKTKAFGKVTEIELHHFADASSVGYAACSYLRLRNDKGEVSVSFLLGKSRVVPLKYMTIPRLELTAALVAVRLSKFLNNELNLPSVKNYYWSDSQVALSYIANDTRRFHTFVANRVDQIRDYTKVDQWFYVPTDQNPADPASRGIGVDAMIGNSIWVSGPKFLHSPDFQALADKENKYAGDIKIDDPEVKKVKVSRTLATRSRVLDSNILGKFSSFSKLIRVIAICLKFGRALKSRIDTRKLSVKENKHDLYSSINISDLQEAEKIITKGVQSDFFSDEIRAIKAKTEIKRESPIQCFDCFLDSDGILRVGGRLKNSDLSSTEMHPVLLPKNSHFSQLVIDHFHKKVLHQGKGITVNAIRLHGYWIINVNSLVSNYIAKCVTCRRLRSSLQVQKMADLPSDRVQRSAPFDYSAVDYFGPFVVVDKRKELKRYGVLFTCLQSRAVHIEVANSLTTDSFINALRRFISFRGQIRVLRCDQGTNFIGAKRELRHSISTIDDDLVREFLKQNNCDFEFQYNAPKASHMAGVWERLIRSTRSVLNVLLDQHGKQLDDEALRTFMCEVMAILNSRPLTVQNLNDPNSVTPLTPNHLIMMKSNIVIPPPGEFQRNDVYSIKRWKRVQYLINQFWARWRLEYLQAVQRRPKWHKQNRNLQIGDVVLIKEENVPRNMWNLGRVTKAFVSDDKLVRSVELQIGDRCIGKNGKRSNTTFLVRPIHKLVLLVES